jgi:hypothetical protein
MPAPDRYLVVRPGLGISLAAVTTSTARSDWVEVADQTAGAVAPTHDTPPALAGHEAVQHSVSADDPYVFDLAHATEWRQFVAAQSRYAGPGETGLTGSGQPGGLTFTHSGGLTSGTFPGDPPDDDPFYYFDNHGVVWMPSATYRSVHPNDSQWTDAWRPAWPDDAIGYEVEQYELENGEWAPLSEPVAATVSFTLSDESTGGQFIGAVTTVTLNDRFGTAQMTAGGVDLLAAPNLDRDNAETATHGIVQTPVGAPEFNADVPAAFTVEDFTASPARSGLLAVWQSLTIPGSLEGTPDSWHNTGRIALITQKQGLTVTYTIRPPRIRWIYASHPYRRITQRGDGLAGGARRVGGRVKTIQGSNRRGAGSVV